MKKLISFILVISLLLLTGCTTKNTMDSATTINTTIPNSSKEKIDQLDFSGLDDPRLLDYIDDCIYSELDYFENSDDTFVYDISSTYISKEYLEEIEFNSQENIYFGYKLSEIESMFAGNEYVFTLGHDNQTTFKIREEYDNSFEKEVLKNIAIGTGVILICVTISTIAAPTGAVSVVFAASAKTAAEFALSFGVFTAVTTAIVTGIKTGDMDAALKSAALKGSNAFKWCAISGALLGGVSKAISIYHLNHTIPSPREAELQVLDKYPGEEQVAFLNKEEVSIYTNDSTRPDIIRFVDDHYEAVEVKRYNLSSNSRISDLCDILQKQIASRIKNLPDGYTQRIVLNTVGQDLSENQVQYAIQQIRLALADIYPNIPIDVLSKVVA